MKAVAYEQYGGPEMMILKEVERPEIGPNEMLIKVMATSVNKADHHILHGKPFPVRIMAGLTKPKYSILGADVAGIVERIGKDVNQFKVGDQVFGDLSASGFGGFAEFVKTSEDKVARKPDSMSFEDSAALPMAAVTALQGLRNHGNIKEGDEVLINGASGGVGSYALQIAKAFGARVTAVCSTKKVENAKNLGADSVIDYKKEVFTQLDKSYDLIFDVACNHSLTSIGKVLNKEGRYVACGFSPSAMILGSMKSLFDGKKYGGFLATTNQADLQFLSKLVDEGKLKAVISNTFTLDDVPEAMSLMASGHANGKLVVTM